MRDNQESVTTGQTHTRTDRQTPDKVIPMCRYATQVTQKCQFIAHITFSIIMYTIFRDNPRTYFGGGIWLIQFWLGGFPFVTGKTFGKNSRLDSSSRQSCWPRLACSRRSLVFFGSLCSVSTDFNTNDVPVFSMIRMLLALIMNLAPEDRRNWYCYTLIFCYTVNCFCSRYSFAWRTP